MTHRVSLLSKQYQFVLTEFDTVAPVPLIVTFFGLHGLGIKVLVHLKACNTFCIFVFVHSSYQTLIG